MKWTCQAGDGPLWWPIADSAHWYRPDTLPEELAAEYLSAHPHDSDRALVLIWWESWGRIGRQVRIERHQIEALAGG